MSGKKKGSGFGEVEGGWVSPERPIKRSPGSVALGDDLKVKDGFERADFLTEHLKDATRNDTYVLVSELVDAWLDCKGRDEVNAPERRTLHKRIYKWLAEQRTAGRAESCKGLIPSGQPDADGWRWNPKWL